MTGQKPRRNNAPIRRRRPATTVPDLLFAVGMALLVMAVVFFAASFVSDTLSNGDVGTDLARLFAGTLTLSALFAFMMGILLLRDDRKQVDHYLLPLAVGSVIGALESALFLNPAGPWLLAPFLLLVFVLRPVRRAVANLVRPAQQGRR